MDDLQWKMDKPSKIDDFMEPLDMIDMRITRVTTSAGMAGIRADELDVILSRIKLAQLLGRGEGQAMDSSNNSAAELDRNQ